MDSRDSKFAKPKSLCKNAYFGPSNAKFGKMHKSNGQLLESNFYGFCKWPTVGDALNKRKKNPDLGQGANGSRLYNHETSLHISLSNNNTSFHYIGDLVSNSPSCILWLIL